MAFDLMRGTVVKGSWARGESTSVAGDFVADKLAEVAKSKIPWKPVAIVGGVLAGLFVLPRLFGGGSRNHGGVPQEEFDPGLMKTVKERRRSMRETVYGGE